MDPPLPGHGAMLNGAALNAIAALQRTPTPEPDEDEAEQQQQGAGPQGSFDHRDAHATANGATRSSTSLLGRADGSQQPQNQRTHVRVAAFASLVCTLLYIQSWKIFLFSSFLVKCPVLG